MAASKSVISFFSAFGEGLEKTAAGLAGLELRIGVPIVDIFSRGQIAENMPDRGVIVTVTFTSPAPGASIIYIPIPFGAALPERVINPDSEGAPEQFSELHRSALGELAAQSWQAAAAGLAARTGRAFKIAAPEVALDTIGNYLKNLPAMLGIKNFYVAGHPSRMENEDFTIIQIAPDRFISLLFPEEGVRQTEKVKITGPFEGKTMSALEAPVVEKKKPAAGGPEKKKAEQPPARAARIHSGIKRNLDVLLDIPVDVTVEIGRASVPVADLMNLSPGTVVGLDIEHGMPVRMLVNGRLIARGQVVTVGDKFGLRIVELVEPKKRLEGF